MKIATFLVAAATAVALVHADDTPAAGTVTAAETPATSLTAEGSASAAPATSSATPAASSATPAASTTAGSSSTPATASGESVLDTLTTIKNTDSYHMKPVRVVHARVQADTPGIFEGRFGSQYGKDLASAYLSSLDTVNTASVEGALMYVQAEGINQNTRAAENRCLRKTNMNKIVFYEILIAQTNETIAQFQDKWSSPEYGPMIPMDSGRCTPLSSDGGVDKLPVECYQFNGQNGQPNLGPFIGAGIKNDDVRAPYPDNYWFSFPNSCPTEKWGSTKTDACRTSTRKGLCDVGKAPDGVTCTFAYDILGWVPIDDVVGITNITNEATGKPYGNFTEWCSASEKNIEFAGDDKSGKMTDGLDFWKDPLDTAANSARAAKVVEMYDKIVSKTFTSTQITATQLALFKPLPDVAALRKQNPPCYETVKACNSGSGCRRDGFSQLCTTCNTTADGCVTDSSYKFPTLAKAKTELSESETTSGSSLNGGSSGSSSKKTPTPSAASTVQMTFGVVAATLIVALTL